MGGNARIPCSRFVNFYTILSEGYSHHPASEPSLPVTLASKEKRVIMRKQTMRDSSVKSPVGFLVISADYNPSFPDIFHHIHCLPLSQYGYHPRKFMLYFEIALQHLVIIRDCHIN